MTEANYQQLQSELDQILDRLQSGETDIDEALELHKHGQEIIKSMESYLKKAEATLKTIKL